MVVQQHTSQVSPFIDFKGDVIQNVTEYKFVGCLFKCNGNLRHSLAELAKKARKVLFSLFIYNTRKDKQHDYLFKSTSNTYIYMCSIKKIV